MGEMVIKRTTKTTHQNASSHSTTEVKGTRDVSTREKMPPGVTLIRNFPGPLTESHGDTVSLILVTGQVCIWLHNSQVNRGLISIIVRFFFSILGGHQYFLWGHWYFCFKFWWQIPWLLSHGVQSVKVFSPVTRLLWWVWCDTSARSFCF